MGRNITNCFIISLLLLLVASACNRKSCEDIECFSPPAPFYLEITEKATGDHVFASDTARAQLTVKDDAGESIQFSFTTNHYVEIRTIGWESESVTYTFEIPGAFAFDLHVEAERLSQDCCTFTRYHKVEITGASSSVDASRGVYQVEIE